MKIHKRRLGTAQMHTDENCSGSAFPRYRGHQNRKSQIANRKSKGWPARSGPVKRRALARMKKILGLLQDGRYPNCNTVAVELEVSPRTAARDLDCMRDDLDLPIEYDNHRHGFRLTKPVQGLPIVPVTSKELFSVCVAHKAIEHYRGTALEKPLELAFKQFASRLDDDERFTLQSLDEMLSLRPFAPDDADLNLFELVNRRHRA